MKKANDLINAGDFDGFNAVEKEINDLDEKFYAAAKAQASLDALKDDHRIKNLADYAVPATPGDTVIARFTAPGFSPDGLEDGDATNDSGYRKAFMNYVVKGTPLPREFRNASENTMTTDVATVIPTVLVNRIIEKIDTIGMVLPLITRTNYKAGINIPTSNVKPVATWVAEGAGSERQKKTTGVITFTNHKLRCEISMTIAMAISVTIRTADYEGETRAMIRQALYSAGFTLPDEIDASAGLNSRGYGGEQHYVFECGIVEAVVLDGV